MVSIISIRFFIRCQDILHDSDPVLENYLFLLSAYFIYDLFVMYQGYFLTMTPSKLPMTSSVDKVMDFFIQKTSIVIHHLLLVIAGIPVVFVSLLFFCFVRIRYFLRFIAIFGILYAENFKNHKIVHKLYKEFESISIDLICKSWILKIFNIFQKVY